MSRFAPILACLILAFSSAGALAADPVDVDVGHLATVGETLGDAPVTEISQHPEFERITVQLPDETALQLEVTIHHPDSSPSCVHHELAVYPRFDLIGGKILPQAAPAIDALCARLEADPQVALGVVRLKDPDSAGGDEESPTRRGGGGEGVVIHVPGPGTRVMRPLHGLLGALLLALGVATVQAWRRRDAPLVDGLGVFFVGLVARLLLSPRGLQIAPDAGFERIVQAWGINEPHPLYGDGYTALHAPLQRLTEWDPAAVFGLHIGISAVAPLLLWMLAWLLLKHRFAALTAGVGMALLPVALRLAGSEVAHVPLASFELLAVLSAVAFARHPTGARAWVAAMAMAFAVHLRPEALPAVLLPVGLLLAPRKGVGVAAVAVLIGLVVWRVSGIPPMEGSGPVRPQAFLSPSFWLSAMWPQFTELSQRAGNFQVFLDLRTTPVLLPLLALFGLVRARRHPRVVALCVAWWVLALLPILPKSTPLMDAWRLQLTGQAPLLLLAAVGVATLPGRLAAAAPALVAITALPLVGFVRMSWAGQVVWQQLQEAVETLPGDAIVLFPDHEVHAAKTAQVGALLSARAGHPDAWWTPMSDFVEKPDPGPHRFAWVDMTCAIARLPGRRVDNDITVNPCLQLAEVCKLTPWSVVTVPDQTDIDITLVNRELGLFRVDDCQGR